MDDVTPTSATGGNPDPLLAFAELARIVVAADPPEQTLRRIAELAKQNLAGVEDVSLTVIPSWMSPGSIICPSVRVCPVSLG